MICNAQGMALIKKWESCRLQAYLDVRGIPTIGWGHTGPEVHLGLTWTQAQADAAFTDDLLHRVEMPLNSMLYGITITVNQFSALCSLVYNIGPGTFRTSTLLSDLHAGNDNDVPAQFLRFEYSNHVLVPGLENRREAEVALWNAA